MKTDAYLSLCLEQAFKSSLHYKHGCIIVNGGKVIGQGYNDYKPGFNGGALKDGRIANGAFDGPAIATLKEKLKKQKDKPKQQQQPQQTFIPLESTGGGHNANIPLSIHSEMMAVHSALAASSTLSSTAFSCEKPCFKLPRSDKRKARLRREALASFKSAVLKLPHINQILHHHGCNNNVQQEQDKNEEQEQQEKDQAFHETQCGEKHQKKKDGKNQKGYQYQCGRYGQQAQQQQPSACKSPSGSPNAIRGYESTIASDTNVFTMTGPASQQQSKHKKDYKRSGKMKAKHNDEPPQAEPLLVPKGRAGERTSNLKDRKKHPRLNGADLYVARLGSCRTNPLDPATQHSTSGGITAQANLEDLSASMTSLPSLSATSSKTSGSLHDELVDRTPSPTVQKSGQVDNTTDLRSVRSSRPCYRCISYMHSVGIKRVFWTNDAGQWEGAKVRDLVDALDNSMDSAAQGGPMGNGVFVTKHEVLMLRRAMGDS